MDVGRHVFLTITHSIFTNNTALALSDSDGINVVFVECTECIGVYVWITIVHSQFTNNNALGGDGGVVHTENYVSVTINFTENSSIIMQ